MLSNFSRHVRLAGIRYLDIRVGYYPDRADKFWMNHNYARINPLRDLIHDLKSFLRGNDFEKKKI